MEVLIEELEKCDYTLENLKKIGRLLQVHLNNLPVAKLRLPAGRLVSRVRKHNDLNELFPHKCIEHISSRKDEENIENFGRCNIPGSSRFYGSIVTPDLEDGNPKINSGYVTNIFETTEMIDKSVSTIICEGYERYTLGIWKLKQPLNLIVVPPYNFENEFSTISRVLKEEFEGLISRNTLTSEQIKFYQILGREFSKSMFGKPNLHYGVSALFSAIILASEDGIAYPSVKALQHSFNVVFSPNAVNSLNLEQIGIVDFFKAGSEYFFRNLYYTDDSNQPFDFKKCTFEHRYSLDEVKDFFSTRNIDKTHLDCLFESSNIPR
jgi:hypothetical protein